MGYSTYPSQILHLMPPKSPFPKVKEAREALKEKALELFEEYRSMIREAREKGEYEIAAKHIQWLIEHMPMDEDGSTMVDPSVDKPKPETKATGPSINIGFNLGGIESPKELPLPEIKVIDVKSES
jgi:hypothetical protein